jgi:hypothetical protein
MSNELAHRKTLWILAITIISEDGVKLRRSQPLSGARRRMLLSVARASKYDLDEISGWQGEDERTFAHSRFSWAMFPRYKTHPPKI